MDHPFYCYKKQCRKTAWETPEYLTVGDLALLERLEGVQTEAEFHELAYASRETAEGFFYRVIGWPEGVRYMQGDLAYREHVGWVMVKRSIYRALASLERSGPERELPEIM